MAKKRKPKKRPYNPPAPKAAPAGATPDAPVPKTPAVRKQNKEEARRARERAIRSMRRRAAIRRAVTFVVVIAVAAALFLFLTRIGKPKLSDETLAAAEAAGCTGLVEQPDRGNDHTGPFVYEDHPATSGNHDGGNTVAAGVYTEPQLEERTVHSMEHGYAVIYYRAGEQDALPDQVLDALTEAVQDEEQTILAPYAQLPDGVDLAFAAWDYLMTCPGSVTPAQATTLASGWIEALRDARTAPEASVD
jgi:hypothetical protein